jgi:hypothetical protein
MISENWYLFIPPLLTLLDDPVTSIRVKGLQFVKLMLENTPANILKQSGLGEVIEDAIMPTLLFLPSLTPVDESALLLRSAYEALFVLADVRFPTKEESYTKMKGLDRIMREGVLQGREHCRDSVKIIEILLEVLDKLICRMGVFSVKHLKASLKVIVCSCGN